MDVLWEIVKMVVPVGLPVVVITLVLVLLVLVVLELLYKCDFDMRCIALGAVLRSERCNLWVNIILVGSCLLLAIVLFHLEPSQKVRHVAILGIAVMLGSQMMSMIFYILSLDARKFLVECRVFVVIVVILFVNACIAHMIKCTCDCSPPQNDARDHPSFVNPNYYGDERQFQENVRKKPLIKL